MESCDVYCGVGEVIEKRINLILKIENKNVQYIFLSKKEGGNYERKGICETSV